MMRDDSQSEESASEQAVSIESTQAEIVAGGGMEAIDGMRMRLVERTAPKNWRPALGAVAGDMERGIPLKESFEKRQQKMPRELRCLMGELISLPDPSTALIRAIRFRAESRAGWQSFIALTTYPTVLLVFALVVGIAFSFCMRSMARLDWLQDMGIRTIANIDSLTADQHNAIVGLGLVTFWVIAVLATVYFVGPPWAWVAIVGGMVVVGKPMRWMSLREILFRYHLLMVQGADLGTLPQSVARSFSNGSQALVAKAIAKRVDRGVSLGRAFGHSMLSDGLCRPALHLLDHKNNNMAEGLRETSELLGTMVDQRCRTLANILPIFALALVGTIVWGALSSYYLALAPLVTLISALA